MALRDHAVEGRDDPQIILSRLRRTGGGARGSLVLTYHLDLRQRGAFVVFDRLYSRLFSLDQPLSVFEFVAGNDAGRGRGGLEPVVSRGARREPGLGLDPLSTDTADAGLGLKLLRLRPADFCFGLVALRADFGRTQSDEQLPGLHRRAAIHADPFDEALHFRVEHYVLIWLQLTWQTKLAVEFLREHGGTVTVGIAAAGDEVGFVSAGFDAPPPAAQAAPMRASWSKVRPAVMRFIDASLESSICGCQRLPAGDRRGRANVI